MCERSMAGAFIQQGAEVFASRYRAPTSNMSVHENKDGTNTRPKYDERAYTEYMAGIRFKLKEMRLAVA